MNLRVPVTKQHFFVQFTTGWSPWTAGCACFVIMVFDVVFLKEINCQSEVEVRGQSCPCPLELI